jgi:hypothetical protein
MKIRSVGAELFHVDGETDRHVAILQMRLMKSIQEQNSEENILTQEGGNNRKLEKTA